MTQHFSVNKTEAGELLQSLQLINARQGGVHVGRLAGHRLTQFYPGAADGFGGTQDGSKHDQSPTVLRV